MKKLQLIAGALLCLSVNETQAQYCESGGPAYNFDTNLQNLVLTGETSTVDYAGCGYMWGFGYPGFEDQTWQFANLIAGNTYSMNVTWGTCGGNLAYAGTVWIDFNGNEDYEPFEIIGAYQSIASGDVHTETYTFTVPTNALNGMYRMRAIQQAGAFLPLDPCASFLYGSLTDFSIAVDGGSDCPAPADFSVDAVGSNSVSVSWSQGASESEWVVEYGPAGFTPGTGVSTTSLDMVETINGLADNTAYDIFVYAVCGPGITSMQAGTTVTTNCLPIQAMGVCETFETFSPTLNCWKTNNANSDNYFWQTQFNLQPQSGSFSAAIYTQNSNGNNDDWLISPNLTLTGNEVMNFAYSVFSDIEPNTFEVLLSTTGYDPADFTTVLMSSNDYNNWWWEDTTIDLSAYSGDVYIAFHVPNGESGWFLFIDDVCFDICTPPSGTDGQIDVCRTNGTIDLNTVVTMGATNGEWEFPTNPAWIDHSILDYSSLAAGTYEAQYILLGGCTNDTTTATITIFESPNAGEGGILNVCQSQPFDLFSGLQGLVDMGGTWYNSSNNPLSSSYINSGNVPGAHNYTYVVGNGVCADAVAHVSVVVDASCNYLEVGEVTLEHVTVYPNPSNGLVSISPSASELEYTYQVVDFAGRAVEGKTGMLSGSNETKVDLSDCEAGVYLIYISNGTSSKTIRLIVQ